VFYIVRAEKHRQKSRIFFAFNIKAFTKVYRKGLITMKKLISMLLVAALIGSCGIGYTADEECIPRPIDELEKTIICPPKPETVTGMITITNGWNLIAMPVLPLVKYSYTVRQFIRDVEGLLYPLIESWRGIDYVSQLTDEQKAELGTLQEQFSIKLYEGQTKSNDVIAQSADGEEIAQVITFNNGDWPDELISSIKGFYDVGDIIRRRPIWDVSVVAVCKNGRYELYPKAGITYAMIPGEAYFVHVKYNGAWCKSLDWRPRKTIKLMGRRCDEPISLNLNRGWNGIAVGQKRVYTGWPLKIKNPPDLTHTSETTEPNVEGYISKFPIYREGYSLRKLSKELVDQHVKATKVLFWNADKQCWVTENLPISEDLRISDIFTYEEKYMCDRIIRADEGFFLLLSDENGLYIPELDSVPEPPIIEPPLIAVKKTLITDRPGSKYNLDIYESKIACSEHRGEGFDTYVYDIDTGQETLITGGVQTPGSNIPAISKDKIAFQSGSGATNIHMYDLVSEKTILITDAQSDQRNPDFFENKIVWEDWRNRNGDIYMCEVFENPQGQIELAERQITDDPGTQLRPAMYGNLIVWEDRRNGNADIYMYNLLTGEERQITSDPTDQEDPAIFENTIVWTDKRNGNEDIYMYDVSTGTETAVCIAPRHQVHPAIHRGVIVWYDGRNRTGEIHLYVIGTGQEYRTNCTPTDPRFLDIYGSRIVWVGSKDGTHAIYTGDFDLHVR
jgi:beta propeller repeat protein